MSSLVSTAFSPDLTAATRAPLSACYVYRYPFTNDQQVQVTDWERFVEQIAKEMVTEQSPRRLLEIRKKLFELLVNCIPATVVLKTLVRELMRKVDTDLQVQLVHWAAYYEHRLQLGSKEIFHLEAFVAKFMSLYKHFLLQFEF